MRIYQHALPGWQEQAVAKLDAYHGATVNTRTPAVHSTSTAVRSHGIEPNAAQQSHIARRSNPRSGTS